MYSSQSCVFAVNHHARALAPQKASKERHRFVVGTCSLHESNELSVLEYHENSNQIEASAIYNHPDQIWAVEPSPNESDLVITSSQSSSNKKALTLYRMPHQKEEDLQDDSAIVEDKLELIEESSYEIDKNTIIQNVKWHPSQEKMLTTDSNGIGIWDISSKMVSSLRLDKSVGGGLNELTCGAASWHPSAPTTCAVGFGSTLHLVDTRKMVSTSEIPNAHKGAIRDIEYNPNKPSILVTAGEDRVVKLWDTRNLSCPVKTLIGHSHFVCCTKFNPFHDQLLLSGGSDNVLNLWRVASCSSAPWIGVDDTEGGGDTSDPPDVKVRSIDQHEDSIYSIAWSPADAW
eukprot:CAMPEP_0119034144 /NCGR_PEP_ID=MMETSP1177-20130426/1171_1 /TAXON_ID=2985 /ORGANISM="Ochromonas sp, Strain CCMP1899" /LENGTH=344 /DNA_ID=CAMNT_0006991389 /DNA_START=99 /DNA_END=1130 /DNA_ORIENTATION=+